MDVFDFVTFALNQVVQESTACVTTDYEALHKWLMEAFLHRKVIVQVCIQLVQMDLVCDP